MYVSQRHLTALTTQRFSCERVLYGLDIFHWKVLGADLRDLQVMYQEQAGNLSG